ncbi:hypothetical protein UlMin_027960 [Ulmus minor]
MPLEVMEKRGVSASSHFFEEIPFSSKRPVQKFKTVPDHPVGITGIPGGKLESFLPSEKLLPKVAQSAHCFEMPVSNPVRLLAERQKISGEGSADVFKASWKPMDDHLKLWPGLSTKPASCSFDEKKSFINHGIQQESSLFSSSLSEIFCRQLRLSGNDPISCQPANTYISNNSKEASHCPKEIDAQTIGNLLPDEDDLFSGMADASRYNAHANSADELEDFDLFSNGGGLELDGDGHSSMVHRDYAMLRGEFNGQGGCNGSIAGEHPSRTLFVGNINSNIEDNELKALFQRYGDIRALYTASKHSGFVMISYYDVRAAQNAMKALHNKALGHRKIDMHYSIPKDNPFEKEINHGTLVVFNLDSSVSNDKLHQVFGFYGEIKKICDAPHKHPSKFIEFYDIRAAEAALHALNKSDICGKQIKIEPGFQWGIKESLMQSSHLEQDEPNICHSPCDNLSSVQKATPGTVASSCMINRSYPDVHFAIGSPIGPFIESSFAHQSSSVPNTLTSPIRMPSASKQFGVCHSNNSLEGIHLNHQGVQSFHPHSLPDHHDNLPSGIACNSSTAIANTTHVGLGEKSGYIRQIHGVSTNRHPLELTGGAFGLSGNGNIPVHEHHSAWNTSNLCEQLPSRSLPFHNSPSFVNGLRGRHFPQMMGFPRSPPHMLSSASPVPHHIGSAPAVNPSLWEKHAYSPETSSLHLSSLRSAGFLGSSPQLQSVDFSSQNIFSQIGGNRMDISAPQHSSEHSYHFFPGRDPVFSLPKSFDSLNESARNLSQRRNEANPNNVDKKQFELDIDRILQGEDKRTTLMIKNIPNKYTSKMLLAAIDEQCLGTYDFLYLPIDFKNKCNVGYAFINMIDPSQIAPFYQAFNGKKWEKFNSEKVAYLAYARIQGKTALVSHFQNSSLMNEDKRCRPILFHTDGPNAGDPEPFPMGTNIRSRSGRKENHNQGSSSAPASREDNFGGVESTSGSSKDSD